MTDCMCGDPRCSCLVITRGRPKRDPRRQRKTPGLPSSCDRCLWSESGACSDHLDEYESYDPRNSIGGRRPAGDPFGMAGNWRAVG